MTEPLTPIMLSALQHYSYCPRQCALIHQEQTFDQIARQTSPFRAGRIAREAKPPYDRSELSGVSAAVRYTAG